MSNDEKIYVKCSHFKCEKQFTEKYHSSGMPKFPVADTDRYHAILEGLISTRLFCMNHAQIYAKNICKDLKITSNV